MNQLTRDHRTALEEYAKGNISLEGLRQRLHGVLEFHFRDNERKLTTAYGTPEPGVRVELAHIRRAMEKHALGEMTTQELSDWASMLLLNSAYEWAGADEDEIAEWLNDISALTLRPETSEGGL